MMDTPYNLIEEEGGTTTCTNTTVHQPEKMTPCIDNRQIQKHLEEQSTLDDHSKIENIDILRQATKELYSKYSHDATKLKKLQFDLEMEQGQINILRHENQALKKKAVQVSALTEQEEEYISNKLLKHITGLKKEKGELLIQVEQEEEYLTNMLQKKLVQVQKEKIDLENALEQEQEYMVNRLQKQLDILRQQQTSPSFSSRVSDTSLSLPVSPAITGIGSSPSLGPKKWIGGDIMPQPSGLVDVLKAEVNSLRQRALEMEKEFIQKQQQCNKYKNELIHYRKENNLPLDDITAADDGSNAPLNLSQSSSTTTLEHLLSSHSSVLPQAIPSTASSSTSYFTGRSSPSVSSSASSSFQRKTDLSSRRVSASLFGLNATPPPQHPPPL
ncbi:hypothetical protein INT48_007324 [Thamnidium elegans]|uniref:Coiled-coil domain-containing protein 6 n=1 Tax=Thamnidium elegans TaxID=101142 RepID=A0A8H7SU86_9FUNG|nr:hypothetical protein INT48_007324 [Thamnidium elegans]